MQLCGEQFVPRGFISTVGHPTEALCFQRATANVSTSRTQTPWCHGVLAKLGNSCMGTHECSIFTPSHLQPNSRSESRPLRMCLILLLIVARGGSWLLEQPASSLMAEYPRFKYFVCEAFRAPWHSTFGHIYIYISLNLFTGDVDIFFISRFLHACFT